jgi:hypothetical protein
MTKRNQLRELSEVQCTINMIEKGNQVIIERYTRWGYTLDDLKSKRDILLSAYKKRWGYLEKKKNLVVSE